MHEYLLDLTITTTFEIEVSKVSRWFHYGALDLRLQRTLQWERHLLTPKLIVAGI